MFSPGARDAKPRRGKRCGRHATSDTIAGLGEANPAKALVMRHIRQLVAEGRAEWAWHENGDIRLQLQTGETFLLADSVIIRIA
jgi:hypothetical protein